MQQNFQPNIQSNIPNNDIPSQSTGVQTSVGDR